MWDETPCYLSLSFRIFAHVCVASACTLPVVFRGLELVSRGGRFEAF